jgi:hypothetical protein
MAKTTNTNLSLGQTKTNEPQLLDMMKNRIFIDEKTKSLRYAPTIEELFKGNVKEAKFTRILKTGSFIMIHLDSGDFILTRKWCLSK